MTKIRFKVIETIIHDNKKIYELTKNDIGYYNFKNEKLLAHMICSELNILLKENEQLTQENEELKKENKGLKKENEELNSIKCFAKNNGINIFNIEEAFHKCWDDNAKLVDENRKLIAALEKQKDVSSDDKKQVMERERETYQDRKIPGWMKSGRFA